MSPEQRATATELTLLRREIATQRASMPQWAANAAEALARWADGPDAFVLAFAAVAVHHWYAALELVFERVARRVDLRLPSTVPADLAGELDELREFRRFFVQESTIDGFEANRVRAHLDRVVRIQPLVSAHLDELDRFLTAAVTSVTT